MIQLEVDFLAYQAIAEAADKFLREYHPSGTIPIPIEAIVEDQLGLDIVPLPNLQRDFEIEGYSSQDLRSIYVDQWILEHRLYRYRYTLAHEVGHMILHGKVFQRLRFESVTEWKAVQTQLDPMDRSALEFQAYDFGGLLLVPREALCKGFLDKLPIIERFIEEAKARELPKAQYIEHATNAMADSLGETFQASTDVISRRIRKDDLEILFP